MKKYPSQKYLQELIKEYPEICSGRKNYKFFHKRINKNIKLINSFFKKNYKL